MKSIVSYFEYRDDNAETIPELNKQWLRVRSQFGTINYLKVIHASPRCQEKGQGSYFTIQFASFFYTVIASKIIPNS